jgi:hypothetical protein
MSGALAARLAALPLPQLRHEFLAQGKFLYVPQALPPQLTQELIGAVAAAAPAVNRNYLPGHKQGGSVSRHELDTRAPAIAQLYRTAEFTAWLSALAGEPLHGAPADDPHAYALYFYTQRGDHIGWHYDTSYYAGRRYTVLIGLLDESSCRLDYELHTRSPSTPSVAGSLQIAPGGLVFFDGDALRHRITPLQSGERRVSLTLEYVTDLRMHPFWRLVSNMKDAFAYFGFRQVFRRPRARAPARAGEG